MKYHLSKYAQFVNLGEDNSFLLSLFNGAKVKMHPLVYNNILKGQYDNTITKECLDKNLLFASLFGENEFVNKAIDEAERSLNNKAILYGVCLSYQCNLACGYCYEKYIHSNKKVLNESDIDNIINIIKELQTNHVSKEVVVVLFGGEPFMKTNSLILPYFFYKMRSLMNYFATKGISGKITVFSNGLDMLLFKTLIEDTKNDVDSYMLTLNGIQGYHNKYRPSLNGENSFQKTLESIDFLLKNKIKVNVRMDLDKDNMTNLTEVAMLIKEKRWHLDPIFRYYISPIRWLQNKEKMLSEIEILEYFISEDIRQSGLLKEVFSLGALRVLHNIVRLFSHSEMVPTFIPALYHCESVRGQQYVLGSDGYIYRCLVSIGKKEDAFGRYFPLLDFDKRKDNMWRLRKVINIQECLECKYAFICGGGCAYSALKRKGSLMLPNCIDIKQIFDKYIDSLKRGININSYGFYYE
ncbi:MAG: SPASM domain-containing protein [Bacteroidales bacterium]|jgi:uncharacterized protein|nr:SPASM domain-containing protein [Bacteroidales bacterium]